MSETPHSAIHAAQYEDVDPQKEKSKGGMVRKQREKERGRSAVISVYADPRTFPTGSFFPCCVCLFVFPEVFRLGNQATMALPFDIIGPPLSLLCLTSIVERGAAFCVRIMDGRPRCAVLSSR